MTPQEQFKSASFNLLDINQPDFEAIQNSDKEIQKLLGRPKIFTPENCLPFTKFEDDFFSKFLIKYADWHLNFEKQKIDCEILFSISYKLNGQVFYIHRTEKHIKSGDLDKEIYAAVSKVFFKSLETLGAK